MAVLLTLILLLNKTKAEVNHRLSFARLRFILDPESFGRRAVYVTYVSVLEIDPRLEVQNDTAQ